MRPQCMNARGGSCCLGSESTYNAPHGFWKGSARILDGGVAHRFCKMCNGISALMSAEGGALPPKTRAVDIKATKSAQE